MTGTINMMNNLCQFDQQEKNTKMNHDKDERSRKESYLRGQSSTLADRGIA